MDIAARGKVANLGIRSEALDWLEEAKADIKHARLSLNGGSYNWACFAPQQAAEKALKAFVIGVARKRPSHVHDLTMLYTDVKNALSCRRLSSRGSGSFHHITQ